MSRQKSGCGCLFMFGLLTLAASGAAYAYFKGFPSVLSLPWQQFTPTEAAKMIPDEAIATGYINTDPQRWSKLSDFGTPEAQQIVRQRLEELQQEPSPGEINYEQDIQPWIEDVSVAFFPSATDESQMLFVIGIRDKLKAAAYFEKLKGQPNQTLTETQHQEITIIETTSPDSEPSYSAVVGKYLLYSSDRSLVEQAIATQKGEPAYYDRPGIKELLSQSLTLKEPLLQIYLDEYDQIIEQSLASLPPEAVMPAQTLKNIKPLNALIIGVGVEATGLHVQAVAQLNPSQTTPATNQQPTSSKLLSYFPPETLMFINGKGIDKGWSDLVEQSQEHTEIQAAVQQVRQNLQMASLDADEEVFGWMDGEFALGLVAAQGETFSNVGLGGVIVWETYDPKTAQNTLDKLNRISIFLPHLAVTKTNIAGKDITQWKSRLSQEVFLSYGWLDERAIAMTVATPFQTVLNARSNNTLPQSQNFKEITTPLPQKNLGYFYIDIEQSFSKVLHSPDGLATMLDAESRAVLDSLKGLAITSTLQDRNTSQIDMILSLKSVDDR